MGKKRQLRLKVWFDTGLEKKRIYELNFICVNHFTHQDPTVTINPQSKIRFSAKSKII